MTRVARHDPAAGFSVLAVVGVVLILSVLGMAAATLVVQDTDLAASQVESNQALYAAHAGIEYAMQKLSSNPSWAGLPAPGKTVGWGSFWVAAPDSLDDRGMPLPMGQRRIVSTGRVGRATRVVQVHVASGRVSSLATEWTRTAGALGDAAGYPTPAATPAVSPTPAVSSRAAASPAVAASPWLPCGIALTRNGDVLFADPAHHMVWEADLLTGAVTPVAGSGTPGRSGDGGRATAARLSEPVDVCVSTEGDIYIADAGAHVVRRVSAATGAIATVAGTGASGGSGDGGLATAARLSAPGSVALGPEGDLYIAERGGHRVRRLLLDSGIITTVAGCGLPGYAGDDGSAVLARLRAPEGIAVAPDGDLYIADTGNHVIRRVARATGLMTTVAGRGAPGASGEGGPATAASLAAPRALDLAWNGDLYIADTGNHRIVRLDVASGTLMRIAGGGRPGLAGDGGASTSARFAQPSGIAVCPSGGYFVADQGNHRIRRITGVLAIVAWIEGET